MPQTGWENQLVAWVTLVSTITTDDRDGQGSATVVRGGLAIHTVPPKWIENQKSLNSVLFLGRSPSNPAAANGGAPCQGDAQEVRECHTTCATGKSSSNTCCHFLQGGPLYLFQTA